MSNFRINTTDTDRLFSVWDALSLYVEKGTHQQLWQHPAFQAAYDFSQHMQQSAYHLKKQLPTAYIDNIRFSQSPSTWVLTVTEPHIEQQLKQFFQQRTDSIVAHLGKLPHIQIQRIHNHWQKSGYLLSAPLPQRAGHQTNTSSLSQFLQQQLANPMLPYIRIRYRQSIWHLNVANSLVGKRLSLLLDDISLKLTQQIGYAPALKITVHPSNWSTSGISLTDIVLTKEKTPNIQEAQQIIDNFLASK